MTKQVQRRRGTATQHTSFTGAEGELSVNTTNKSVHVHDGSTAGGIELARKDGSNVAFTSGTLDGVTIGGSTAGAGTFTNLTATGTTTLAGASTSGNITFGDNDKAIFGAGSDLQIFSDGTKSYLIENGSGDFEIRATDFVVKNAGNTKIMASFNDGDTVQLRYDNAVKLSTSSSGVNIAGTLTSDGLTVDGDAVISSANARLRLKETDTTDNDTQLQTTGGVFKISRLDDDNSTATQRFTIDNSTGDISFYEDTGTTAKLHWSAADESLGIGLSSASHVLDVTGDKDTWITKLYNSGSDANASGLLVRSDATAAHDASVLGVYADGGYKMMVKSSGNVGIGTSSPSAPLQVKGSAGEIRLQRPTASQSDWSFKLPSSGGELTFYDNNNAAERMRITSDGSVGIGTSSPSDNLHIASSLATIRLEDSDVAGGASYSLITSSSNGNIQFSADPDNVRSSTDIRFSVDGSEAARLDASGNLLVGKTSSSSTVQGIALKPNGQGVFTSDGGTGALFNRLTSDGDILEFRKDGTTVGSIATKAGELYLGSANTGVRFYDTGDAITPFDVTGATGRDAAIDIGVSSTRFKDLYLSGGVYLGGTGAANKLDDYEEGTWTPTAVQGITGFTLQRASYTKVGRLVYVQAYLSAPSGKSGSAIRLGGLPFTAGTNVYSGGFLDTATDGDVGFVRTNSSSTQLHVYSWDASTVHRNNMTGNEAGSQLIFSVVYEVA